MVLKIFVDANGVVGVFVEHDRRSTAKSSEIQDEGGLSNDGENDSDEGVGQALEDDDNCLPSNE